MPDSRTIAGECRVMSRYLIGQLPDDYILRKYIAAFDSGPNKLAVNSSFECMLVWLARLHPLLTQFVDVYSRFFLPASAVRRRLVFLLAILETWAPTAAVLEQPDHGGLAGFIFGMGWRSIVSGVLLLLSIITLLPFQLLLGRRYSSQVAG